MLTRLAGLHAWAGGLECPETAAGPPRLSARVSRPEVWRQEKYLAADL